MNPLLAPAGLYIVFSRLGSRQFYAPVGDKLPCSPGFEGDCPRPQGKMPENLYSPASPRKMSEICLVVKEPSECNFASSRKHG